MYASFFMLLSVAIFAVSCGKKITPTLSRSDALQTEFDPSFSEFGLAFRSFSEERLATRCIENREGHDHKIETDEHKIEQKGLETEWSITEIKSSSDLLNGLDLSMGAQLQATGVLSSFSGAAASSKVGFAKSIKLQKSSTYYLVKVRVIGQTTAIAQHNGLQIKSRYTRRQSETAEDHISRFLIDCGDMYLHSITEGGELFGIVELESETQQSMQKSEASLSLKGKLLAGGDASSANKISNIMDRAFQGQVSQIWVYQKGGRGENATPIDNLQSLKARASKFSLVVEENPVIINSTYRDYTELLRTGMGNIPTRQANNLIYQFNLNQSYLPRLANLYSQIAAISTELEATKEEAHSYSPKSANHWQVAMDLLEQQRSKLGIFMRSCYVDYGKCRLEILFEKDSELFIELPNYQFSPNKKKKNAFSKTLQL